MTGSEICASGWNPSAPLAGRRRPGRRLDAGSARASPVVLERPEAAVIGVPPVPSGPLPLLDDALDGPAGARRPLMGRGSGQPKAVSSACWNAGR